MALRSLLAFVAVFLCLWLVNGRSLESKGISSLHASCKIKWGWNVNCSDVNTAIVSQIKKWKGPDNCDNGGEKCLYELKMSTPSAVKATHTTPKRHFVDDLSFTFTKNDQGCGVQGYSKSELWYAILDYGTNYCNLHNLITGAGLDKMPGYTEKTSNSMCTQYTSADCKKY